MDNLDLNIQNYNFEDILNLFKLTKDYNEEDIISSKKMVLAIHPDNSKLDKCYYKLFSEAYEKIYENYNMKISNNNIINNDTNSIFLKVLNKEINKEDYVDIIKESEKNSSLKSLLNNKPYPNLSCSSCYNSSIFNTQVMTIHTEDRDITKWPFENNFEVELPLVIKNVLSVELYDITLPSHYYNISENLQNTSLWFSIPQYFQDPIELILDSGFYNEIELIQSLQNNLNKVTANKLYLIQVYAINTTTYDGFDVSLNKITQKITINNKLDQFDLWCQKKSNYNDCIIDNWKMNIEWGLPYNLGFNKSLYNSIYDSSNNIFVLEGPNNININISNTIYMEIDKFNYINEIAPFSKSTTSYFNNDYYGKVNSAFAKLILSNVSNTYIPIKKFKRILPHMEEKVARLKFRFRYHNGNLVDFINQNFNFSLRFECRFDCKY
jgi:hypothetical protein